MTLSIGLVLILALFTQPCQCYFEWSEVIPSHEKPSTPAPIIEANVQDEIRTYHEIMDSIRELEKMGLLSIRKTGRQVREVKSASDDLPRVCGRKMVNVITALCMNGCDDKDIGTLMCAQGYTEEMVVKRCCPTSYRHDIARPFVF